MPGGGEASVTEREEREMGRGGEGGDGVRLRGSLSLFEVGG